MNDNSPPGEKEGWQQARSQPPANDSNPPSNTPSRDSGQASGANREARRGWANCFAATKTDDWQADFTGVITLEDGSKFWVNLYKKLDRNRERYVSVNLRAWKARGS